MKKKFIAVYALIGVLALGSTTLTSCVDDNESASVTVTAVRDAKAAQLNAIAEAETALANLRNAKAAIAEAEAANEAAKLPQIQAEVAAAAQEAQNRLEEAMQTLVKDQQQHIVDLATNYQTAQSNVISLTRKIAERRLDLAELAIDTINPTASTAIRIIEKEILSQKRDMAEYQAELDAYNTLDGANQEELKNRLKELQAIQTVKNDSVNVLNGLLRNAQTAYTNIVNPLQGTTVAGVAEYDDFLDAVKAIDTLRNELPSTPSPDPLELEWKYVDEDNTIGGVRVYSLNQAAATVARHSYQDAVELAVAILGKSDDAAVTTDPGLNTWSVSTTSTAYAHYNFYKDAQKAADDALKAYTGTDADVKDGLQKALDDANYALSEAQEIYLDAYQEDIDDARAAVASFDAAVATLTEGSEAYKEYTAAIDAALASEEAQTLVDLNQDIKDLNTSIAVLGGEITAVNNLNASTLNIEDRKAELAYLIAECEEQIASLENENVDAEQTAQNAYNLLKNRIANLEEQLTYAEAIAEKCKSDLEAAINGSGSTTTPSEGEETPAA